MASKSKLKVQTRVCPVCNTCHDLPLCPERRTEVKAAILVLAIASLSGCAICREHQTACATAGWVAATAVVLSATNGRNATTGTDGRDYTIPRVDCSTGACQ